MIVRGASSRAANSMLRRPRNSISLLQEALDNFGWLTEIGQVMTDHGTRVLRQYIKARVKHPQSNGKFEKWNDTYEI